MAELIDQGKIEITKDEIMKPIEIKSLNFIQVPKFDNTHGARENPVVWISSHGINNGSASNPNVSVVNNITVPSDNLWIEFVSGDMINISKLPFFIMCKFECSMPAIEA